MVARDPYLHAVIAGIGEVKPLAEQLLPAVFAVGRRRIGRVLAHSSGCPDLAGCIPDTCRPTRNRRPAVVAAVRSIQHVEVDRRRVVHHVGIVFAGKDVTRRRPYRRPADRLRRTGGRSRCGRNSGSRRSPMTKSSASVSRKRGNFRSTPRTQKPSAF